MLKRRLAPGFATVSLGLLVACTGAPPASTPAAPGSTGDARIPSPTPPLGTTAAPSRPVADVETTLRFSEDKAAAAESTVTLAAGGTISATASDGTTFELTVPPNAVPEDTLITLTPLENVEGLGDGPVHAVQLQPEGLELYEWGRLTITPATPIAVENQLMFEAVGDGTNAQPALIDPAAEPIVLLLEHFSIGGVGSTSNEQRAVFLAKSAANSETRINGLIRDRIQAERMRQLTGTSETDEGLDLSDLIGEYQREVIDKLRQAAEGSCNHLSNYLKKVIGFERQVQLLGAGEEQESQARLAEAAAFASSRYEACEKKAIAQCRQASDPSILIRFWLANESPADQARAEKLCTLADYRIDKTVSVTELNVSVSIRYTGIKCGGPAGEWVIDSAGTLEGYGGSAEIGGPIVVQINEGTLTGTLEGTANFSAATTGQTQGRFAGTAVFVENPGRLDLTVTSGGGNGYQFGFLDTGFASPGTLTLPLEAGNFCE